VAQRISLKSHLRGLWMITCLITSLCKQRRHYTKKAIVGHVQTLCFFVMDRSMAAARSRAPELRAKPFMLKNAAVAIVVTFRRSPT
jgi:hypothetical protein